MGFVIGCHRSGTSLLCSVLHRLSGSEDSLPFDFMPSGPDNPYGFYESRQLVNLNNRILESLGFSWDLPWITSPDPTTVVQFIIGSESEKFIETHPIHHNWYDKDPRLSLTIDIISAISRHEHPCIGVIRHPLDVAQSLQRRNRLSRIKGLCIWILYNYHAFVKNDNRPLVTIEFESLCSGHSAAVKKLGLYLQTAVVGKQTILSSTHSIPSEQVISECLSSLVDKNAVHGQSYLYHSEESIESCAIEMWECIRRGSVGLYTVDDAIRNAASSALNAIRPFCEEWLYQQHYLTVLAQARSTDEENLSTLYKVQQAVKVESDHLKHRLGNATCLIARLQSDLLDSTIRTNYLEKRLQNERLDMVTLKMSSGDLRKQIADVRSKLINSKSRINDLHEQLRLVKIRLQQLSTRLRGKNHNLSANLDRIKIADEEISSLRGKATSYEKDIETYAYFLNQGNQHIRRLGNLLVRVQDLSETVAESQEK